MSLHAPTQALRETLVPSAKAYPLEALMAECVTFGKVTGRRVTFEYTLLAGVNDSNGHVSFAWTKGEQLGIRRNNILTLLSAIQAAHTVTRCCQGTKGG